MAMNSHSGDFSTANRTIGISTAAETTRCMRRDYRVVSGEWRVESTALAKLQTVTLTINGEARELSATTLSALLTELGMKPDRVAVELNREIVPRAQWE